MKWTLRGTFRGTWRETWRGSSRGTCGGGLGGRLGGLGGGLGVGLGGGLGEITCRGTPKRTSERIWKGTCCHAQVRYGPGKVWSSLQPKFNSFELDSEVGRLVSVIND